MKNFNFKKKYGQNFLNDKNLLLSICNDANLTSKDEVLEIGAGMGALTLPLSKTAKKVVAYEIDQELKEILLDLNLPNVAFYFEDILKKDTLKIEQDFSDKYKLVANLPYYITTPLIFKFLKESVKLSSMTIMVQKEVGERIVAKVGDKNYGALSVSCSFFGEAKIVRKVPKTVFVPQPEVDSCVVNFKISSKRSDTEKNKFFDLVKMAFKSRRKTLLNNLCEGLKLKKEKLLSLDFNLLRRAEQLDCQEFISLLNLLSDKGMM